MSGATVALFGEDISVRGSATLGSFLSARSSIQVNDRLSVWGSIKVDDSALIDASLVVDSSFSTHSFVRLGSSLSVFFWIRRGQFDKRSICGWWSSCERQPFSWCWVHVVGIWSVCYAHRLARLVIAVSLQSAGLAVDL